MTTFCLLHGAWHEPSCWDALRKALRERELDSRAPDLPLHDPAAGYAERIQPALDAVEDVDGPVVVVGHSQSAGLAPLVAAARPVAKVVYLCPRRLGPFEESPADAPPAFREGLPMPQNRDDGTSAWDPEVAAKAMYGRLPEATAGELAQRLRPMAMPPDDYPLSAHPDVPADLIYCADDEFFTPEWERYLAREQLGVEAIELAGGHFPMVEQPERLADVL